MAANALRALDAVDPQFPPARASRLLTAEQLADRWQVSKGQVYRLCREGRVPHIEIGRYYRFRLDAIEQWEEAQ